MVRLDLSIQLASMLILAATLLALLSGTIEKEPASVAIVVSLLGQIGVLVSSSPLAKKTPIEGKVITHLKEKSNSESRQDFDKFLQGLMDKQTTGQIFTSLVDRKIIGKKTVTKPGGNFEEVRLRLLARYS